MKRVKYILLYTTQEVTISPLSELIVETCSSKNCEDNLWVSSYGVLADRAKICAAKRITSRENGLFATVVANMCCKMISLPMGTIVAQ